VTHEDVIPPLQVDKQTGNIRPKDLRDDISEISQTNKNKTHNQISFPIRTFQQNSKLTAVRLTAGPSATGIP
jgi:hypothetical protein